MGVPSWHLKTDAKASELDRVPITLKLMKVKIMINNSVIRSLLSGLQEYLLNLLTCIFMPMFKIHLWLVLIIVQSLVGEHISRMLTKFGGRNLISFTTVSVRHTHMFLVDLVI
jgi:hypothetical protein